MKNADLTALGFIGFIPIKDLYADLSVVPDVAGCYVLTLPDGLSPSFIIESTGGHFKRRNPTVSADKLTAKWLDDEPVIYVGKAGGRGSKATLRKRLKSYFDFGTGKPVGHWGGRYIWQLAFANDLIVAWKTLGEGEASPSDFEGKLIRDFKARCGKYPFANLRC